MTFQVGPISILWAAWNALWIRSTYIFAALLLTIPVACLTLILTVSAIIPDEDHMTSGNISIKLRNISKKIKRRSNDFFNFKRGSIYTDTPELSTSIGSKSVHGTSTPKNEVKDLTPRSQIRNKRNSFEQYKSVQHITPNNHILVKCQSSGLEYQKNFTVPNQNRTQRNSFDLDC
jgi:hypothetical protein